ncbi:phosphate propanoyltransferase [Thermanaerovibrio acidaminovorans]|jgi:propanediol utilization protein|uniref:Phosphate propanoyltransferase n=1 Tax=Thermanaerovibrio acidaminovorans (strain ATCC 49978 / DSM 6589 / Su883) TaxID=525903 RepID=D1B7R3_THEAS|nr:phosphate propanoyltransferase [Thermanaerovibrio acidaminovorans]ACZ18316.1 Propanediol utilization protein [Thermanaerovibrio acidaminovorans DSM 6589]
MGSRDTGELADRVLEVLRERFTFPVEASGRHVHLSGPHVAALFGEGHVLSPARPLSQPGQFLCEERVTLVGPKGEIRNVAVLGPERGRTQVEVSLTDGAALGIQVPVRESGQVEGTPGVLLVGPRGEVQLEEGLIAALRHIHMDPLDAALLQVRDGQTVSVRVEGDRPVIFEQVLVRVSPKFQLAMHIDYDEANACGYRMGVRGRLVP